MKKKTLWLTSMIITLLFTLSVSSTSLAIRASAQTIQNIQQIGNSDNSQIKHIEILHYKIIGQTFAAQSTDSGGYGLMGISIDTSNPIKYYINYSNAPKGIASTLETSASTWDSETSAKLFGGILGGTTAKYGKYDGKNVITFDKYRGNPQVIAVTSIWYNTATMKVTEFDMLFNTKYSWGNASYNSNVMDIQNIATHEFGHVVGLDDLYSDSDMLETMYGYSDYGETYKRDLYTGDINGVHNIYGN
ncbi:MAG: matrixin family metalloprotease [Clostridiaceae bacterium]